MTDKNHQPKPDDRSDNAEKLQDMVQDTMQNLEEAQDTMEFSSGEDKEKIKAKNERREKAIEGMRDEIKDERNNE
ncbi:small acid-soluble spore protein Tlp [Virgibacillus saliphilus]|uniref:small acid-soluble spore protein Tlp n=1 Tax=Virgibacillus saliphilus TaxID=2831674 RepID=UPI0035CCCC48